MFLGCLFERSLRSEQPSPTEQEESARLGREKIDLQATGEIPRCLRPCREQDMATEGGRQELAGQGQVIGIVQDEEPVCVALEPVLDRNDDPFALLLLLLRQVEQPGEGEVGGEEIFACVGQRPEHGLIVPAMAIGILQGQLRFADAS
jgi:hypothetical protein